MICFHTRRRLLFLQRVRKFAFSDQGWVPNPVAFPCLLPFDDFSANWCLLGEAGSSGAASGAGEWAQPEGQGALFRIYECVVSALLCLLLGPWAPLIQKAEPPGLFSYTFIGACRIVSVFLFIVVLGIQLRALCMLGQHFIRPHARSTAVLLGGNNMYVIRRLRNGIRITLHLQSPWDCKTSIF